MNPFDLLQSPLVIVVYALIILAVLKVIAPNGIDLDDMLQLPADREWPRGVHEEEPVPWRVELLNPSSAAPATGRPEPVVQPNAAAHS